MDLQEDEHLSTKKAIAKKAIIGGTGVYDAQRLKNNEQQTMETPFGKTVYTLGEYGGDTVVFLPRHGEGHHLPPHQVPYRANLYALRELGVTEIYATAAVGSVHKNLPPGSLVVVDQFLDFTKSRPVTFFEDGNPVTHVDMTDPFCGRLRKKLAKSAAEQSLPIVYGGTYVCTEGPRFETSAEIRMFDRMGGDVVGMTAVPEVVLAKELGMCYASVAMVTNYCSGITGDVLTHQEVLDVMSENVHRIRDLFFHTLLAPDPDESCTCRTAAHAMNA